MPDTTDYTHTLRTLLPPGVAWPHSKASALISLLESWAEESVRVEVRNATLVGEAVPDTAEQLLPRWERLLGLSPATNATQAVRRQEVQAALLGSTTASDAQQQALAHSLGWALQFAYFTPARAGAARAGTRCYGTPWAYARRITGSHRGGASNPARTTALRAALEQHQPAHTYWIWALA